MRDYLFVNMIGPSVAVSSPQSCLDLPYIRQALSADDVYGYRFQPYYPTRFGDCVIGPDDVNIERVAPFATDYSFQLLKSNLRSDHKWWVSMGRLYCDKEFF